MRPALVPSLVALVLAGMASSLPAREEAEDAPVTVEELRRDGEELELEAVLGRRGGD